MESRTKLHDFRPVVMLRRPGGVITTIKPQTLYVELEFESREEAEAARSFLEEVNWDFYVETYQTANDGVCIYDKLADTLNEKRDVATITRIEPSSPNDMSPQPTHWGWDSQTIYIKPLVPVPGMPLQLNDKQLVEVYWYGNDYVTEDPRLRMSAEVVERIEEIRGAFERAAIAEANLPVSQYPVNQCPYPFQDGKVLEAFKGTSTKLLNRKVRVGTVVLSYQDTKAVAKLSAIRDQYSQVTGTNYRLEPLYGSEIFRRADAPGPDVLGRVRLNNEVVLSMVGGRSDEEQLRWWVVAQFKPRSIESDSRRGTI